MTDAISTLTQLMTSVQRDGPVGIDIAHDQLRLLGIVIGQMTLLQVATNPSEDPKTLTARVSAAKALVSIKESPESIADRLRRSPFADLTVAQLERIVLELKQGRSLTDLPAIIAHVKEKTNGTPHP